MFAKRPRTENLFRTLLVAVILFNALIPTTAAALPAMSAEKTDLPIIHSRGIKGETGRLSADDRIYVQDGPPTATPTVVESTTPEPVATPSPVTEGTPANTEVSPTPSPTPEATPTPSLTPAPTQAIQTSTDLPNLLLEFSVAPEQAKVGDQVTFTLKVVNSGSTPVTGLRFSNVVSELFSDINSDSERIQFDSLTRELTWVGASDPSQGGGAVLVPSESLILQYKATIVSDVLGAQIIESITVNANGLEKPLTAETTLALVDSKSSLTMMDIKGGEAFGLNGSVRVKFPEESLDAPGAILIQDLRPDSPPKTDGEPWLVFELQVRSPKIQDTQFLTYSGNDTSSLQPTETPAQEGLTGETPQTAVSITEEKDRIVPLEPIETQFKKPVELTVSLDGFTDLSTLSADLAPYLVTLDKASGTWVRVPLETINRETNTVTAKLTHFSTWGVGIGYAFPQNGAGVLLFDRAYASLFTGSAQYSIPIWTPPGRNGMAPSLALSYSSGSSNGLLGDIQAPWVGMGWSMDSVEIARKITNGACNPCGSGSYGYENKFLLLFNGTGYEMIPDGTTAGRYHTKAESFLYIQLHNNNLGNNSPAAQNATSEWWEVVTKDGTRWRLGWTADSEQLAAMKGYPGAATGAWATLGYAGAATNVVAARWRAEQVTDTFGNKMNFAYFKESRVVNGTSANYDRASYLDTVTYTGHTSGTPTAGYSVVFVRESRSGSEVPSPQNDWDNWDTYRLDRIEAKYGSTVKRTYDLSYGVRSYSDSGASWQTTVLTAVAVSGGGISAPTITFSYVDKDNRAVQDSSSKEWAYPRLEIVANGWEGNATYAYGNDGRPYTSWYNWRAETLDVVDGMNASPMKTTYAYSTPCYNDATAGWCNGTSVGELVGYGQTTATTKDFNGTTTLGIAVHKFHTDEQKAGREYEAQYQDPSGTILSQTNTTFTVVTSGLPTGGYFTYASAVEGYLRTASLTRVSKTEYSYSSTTGNLTWAKEYDGTPALYRQTDYEYVTNTSASVWILGTLARRTLKDAAGTVLAKQEYGYDGSLPVSGSPTVGKLTLSRLVDGTQTIDTSYEYDTYGNVTETRLFKAYGNTSTLPSGAYLSYVTGYDSLKTYVTSTDPPLIPATTVNYDFGLGAPTTITDTNGNTTTTAYDGLGRVTSVTYPGFGSPNIKYTYPAPSGSPLAVSAPFSVKTEIWDQTASVYRAGWQILDGLGRTIQIQSPYETTGYLVLSDVSYNAQGLAQYQGLPRTLSGTGGSHFAPTWGSVPHSTFVYNALGRVTSVAYPDSSQETFSYSGLRTTAVDRNNHQKIQENDAFGRLVKVEEYTGSGTYTLYGTTTYTYDVRDLLKTVTDAASNQTTINYDGFGRKTEMTDPDMGNWRYRYNALGNLTAQIDAKRQAINIYYDDLNRMVGKTYTTGPVNPDTYQPPADPGYSGYTVKYYYDSGTNGYGHRTSMVDASGTTSWSYNALGQPTNETRNIESTNYSLSATFDAFGRPLTQTLPSSEVLNYSYNAMGSLSGLSGTNTYVSQIHYNASGQVTDQQLGNGLKQQSCYEANTLRLSKSRVYSGTLQSCTTNPSGPRLNLSFSYQPNGNVGQIVDATQNETVNYIYDELDRLLSASGSYFRGYSYNSPGNILSQQTTPSMVDVVAGGRHTCSLTSSGAVYCWGYNYQGQIGDGTIYNYRTTPVSVNGLNNGVIAITAGEEHTCALTTSGGVKCWGENSSGRLGDGTTTDRTSPVNVNGLTSGVVAVTAGGEHTCALISGGGVKCWGENSSGQLGDGTTTDRTTPVDVSGLTNGVIAIAAGEEFTCALTTSGGVKCWGNNNRGQLGDGTTTQRLIPVDVTGLTGGVSVISAGNRDHACAVTTSGGAKCWGANSWGKLGDGTTNDQTTPVNVSGLTTGVTTIEAGHSQTCAVTASGGAKCWGFNLYGELGDGTYTYRTTAVDVTGLTTGVVGISAGGYTGGSHTCALTSSGGIKCWGENTDGRLGDGEPTDRVNTPVDVSFSTSAPSNYTYGDSAHKHAVTALSTGETYTYDANGNMTQRVEGGQTYTQTFDAENRLISVTVNSQTTQFIYDGDGNLVKKIKPDGSKTIYIGGVYEVDKNPGGSVTRTVTYYPGGAMRINSTLYYVLKDHLGSASVVTDASGNIVGEQRYYPYGETRLSTGGMYTDKLYTGQREMADLGIYHYQARFYSPKLGRFLSADTVVPNPFNPQNLNRFSYVRNNPLRYTDPSGHMDTPGDDGGCRIPNCGLPLPPQPPRPQPNPNPTPSPIPSPIPSPVPSPTPSPIPSPTPSPTQTPSPTYTPTYTPPVSTGTPPSFTQTSSSDQNGDGFTLSGEDALLVGALLFIATAPVDVALIALPLVPGVGLPAHLLFLPLDLAMLNITLVSIEMMSEGSAHPNEQVTIDPLPLIHWVFPDF